MTFISYAQNYEDIMLFRALRDIEQGFYVDVGANSPDEHSVTKAFYDRGWRGINIEPVLEFHQQLLAARTRDINLPIAVADTNGFIDFYDVPGTGLSTISPKVAEGHRAAGYEVVKRSVVVETLEEVFRKYVSGHIHFLKIDVEGLEESVLHGVSLKDFRPWIVVVEATEVLSEVQNHASWEHLLTERGYSFVYFDGLNRFYVADERSELVQKFRSPPNVFDDWMRVGDRRAHDNAYLLSLKLQEDQTAHRAELEVLKAQVEEWKSKAEALQVSEEKRRADESAWQARDIARRAEDEARRADEEGLRTELTRVMEEAAGLRAGIAEMREEFAGWLQMNGRAGAAGDQATASEVELTAQLAAASAEIIALRHRIVELEHAYSVAELNLDAILASSSWRITAPIRAVKTTVVSRARTTSTMMSGGQQLSGSMLRRAAHWSARQPIIKRAAVAVLARSPALERKVRSIVAPPPGVQMAAVADIPPLRQLERSGPVIVSRNPSRSEVVVETAFQRAMARAR
jgi:FkbM family methyltransferase